MNTEIKATVEPVSEATLECQRRLKILGNKLEQTDRLLVHLMARRLNLALKVAAAKHPIGMPTVRLPKEKERLDAVTEWAEIDGVNGEFPRALLYMIIGESCKVQADYREQIPAGQKVDYSLPVLRNNLLELTREFAMNYDAQYAPKLSLKRAHADFEHLALLEIIEHLPLDERDTLLDIGCATGREAFLHTKKFRRIIGYDVSPDMIKQATARASWYGKDCTLEFSVQDVEQGLPKIADASVSCVYLNHGTASDIPDIGKVLTEIRRVLKPGGVFLLSFYNSSALMYQAFLPWPPVLGAEVDNESQYIEVAVKNKIIPVYAKAYTPEEAEMLLPQHLALFQTMTHPTIGSIAPKDVFEGKHKEKNEGEPEIPPDVRALEAVKALDINLAQGGLGAYVILTGKKV